jgi:hypothetical protein
MNRGCGCPARRLWVGQTRLVVILTFVLIGVALPTGSWAQYSTESSPIPEAWSRLTSDGLDLAERAAAATDLLEMRDSEATGALSLALTTQQSRLGWRAVIQAVATFPDDPPKQLAQPLIGLLGQVDAGMAPGLAAALGRFDQSYVIKRLSKIARDKREPIARRCGAVLALGYDRTTQTAGLLMELTDAGQPEDVQQASFKALGTLTALDNYDADRQAWESWWKKNKGLWAKEWTQHLLENFERREARRPARDHELEDMLLESQRALYQANSPEGRPDVLVYLLGKPLVPIRQLGMDLTRQRLLDDLPFDEPLREALRKLLTDPIPSIRAQAAEHLRDLSDAPAAEMIAVRLGEESEQVASVLSAYLQMMARLPQNLAVDPATELLNDEALRADAASALSSAFDAGLMKRSQVNRAAKLARKYVHDGQPPAPSVITLMGKVGNKDDWKRIAQWVDHPDASVKHASAQAWADSERPLNLLADRIGDPTIQPILIAAATRRGDQAYTLNILTTNRPQRERSVEPWRRALVAMASRVPPGAVLASARHLSELGESPQLRLEIISAAIDRPEEDAVRPAERLELLLSRGEMRLNNQDPAASLADFQAVAVSESELTDAQRDRLGRGQISANLQLGQIDGAFVIARKLLGPASGGGVSPTDDRIVAKFIKTAQRFREQGRKDEVATITRELRNLLRPAIKPAVGSQLATLDAWVHGSVSSTPPMTAADDLSEDTTDAGSGPVAE